MQILKKVKDFFSTKQLRIYMPKRAYAALESMSFHKGENSDATVARSVKDALITQWLVMQAIRKGGKIHAHFGGGNFIPLDLRHLYPNESPPKTPPPTTPFSVIKGGKE